MLKIRLARIGKRKKPTYRIIISESARDTYGRFLELLGHYNPFTKVCEVKKDRVLYWISQGAKLSPTIHNLFVDQNVITGAKVKAYRPKKKEKEEGQKPAGEKKEVKEEPVATKPKVAEEKPAEKPTESPEKEKKPVAAKEESRESKEKEAEKKPEEKAKKEVKEEKK